MEGDGVALGKPREGEGNVASDTDDDKVDRLLMCSLTTLGLENKLLC